MRLPPSEPIPGSIAPVLSASVSLRQWRCLLAVVLLVYACLQFFSLTATPLQTLTLPDNMPQGESPRLLVGLGPDEKEHFLYVRSLADQGALPAPDLQRRTSPRQYVTYQAQHPPLFYALAALIYRVAAGLPPAALWCLLRSLCAVCGGIVIVLAAEAARLTFPDRPLFALAAAPAVAFLPIFGYMTATLSNEPLEMVFGAAVWLQLVRLARGHTPYTVRAGILLGLTLGLAALTRLTALLWLPAIVIVLTHCARRSARPGVLLPPLASLLCSALLLAPWLLHNNQVFGSPLVRVYYRPLIGRETLVEFFFGPEVSWVVQQTVPAYAVTSWLPYWLVRQVLPGGVSATSAWQMPFVALDGVILASLFVYRRRRRREEKPPDRTGRVLIWAAGSAVAFCVLILLQQQLLADWQVIFYAGRYLVASAPAGALLLLTACSAWGPPTGRSPQTVAAVLAVCLLALDVTSITLVRQFYAAHPDQPRLQRLR